MPNRLFHALAGAFLAAASLPAAAVTVTGSTLPAPGQTIQVGDVVLAEVTFDFGAGYNLLSTDLRLAYDPDRLDLRLAQSTVSYAGYTLGVNDFFAALTQFSPLDPPYLYHSDIDSNGDEYHAWSAIVFLDQPLTGPMVLTGAFEVLAGGQSTVSVSGALADWSLVAQNYSSNIMITAVPEPETWVMVLAGLGLLGWRLRTMRVVE